MTKYIRTVSGDPIGILRQAGTRINATNMSGKLLGWYLPTTDATFNADGIMIAFGDITPYLICKDAKLKIRK